jgi:hypothetical protein
MYYGYLFETGSKHFFKVLDRTSSKIIIKLISCGTIFNLDVDYLDNISILEVVK